MQETTTSHDPRRALFVTGHVSAKTLARWALVRQIAELEEALADTHHSTDYAPAHFWSENTRKALADKRAALGAI